MQHQRRQVSYDFSDQFCLITQTSKNLLLHAVDNEVLALPLRTVNVYFYLP